MFPTWYSRSRRAPIDPERLRGKLERAVMACADHKGAWRLPEIDRVLVAELGPWVGGWCWGNTDGGPVSRWCCVAHSFLAGKPKEEPARTVDRILGGLEDWEKILRDCETLFESLLVREPFDLDIAVLELVGFAVTATDASDAWYNFCHDLLSWYLQHLGISQERAERYARKAIAGRFESWISPDAGLTEKVAESFRALVWRALAH